MSAKKLSKNCEITHCSGSSTPATANRKTRHFSGRNRRPEIEKKWKENIAECNRKWENVAFPRLSVCLPAVRWVVGGGSWLVGTEHRAVRCIITPLSHFSLSYRTLRLACQYLCLLCIWHIDLNANFVEFWYIYRIWLAKVKENLFCFFYSAHIFPSGSYPSLLFRSSPPETPLPAPFPYHCHPVCPVWGICWPQFIHLWTRWTSDYQLPSILYATTPALDSLQSISRTLLGSSFRVGGLQKFSL